MSSAGWQGGLSKEQRGGLENPRVARLLAGPPDPPVHPVRLGRWDSYAWGRRWVRGCVRDEALPGRLVRKAGQEIDL